MGPKSTAAVAMALFGVAAAQFDLMLLPCSDQLPPVFLKIAAHRDCTKLHTGAEDCSAEALAAMARLGEVLSGAQCHAEMADFLRKQVADVPFDDVMKVPVGATECRKKGTPPKQCLDEAYTQLDDALLGLMKAALPADSSKEAKNLIGAVGPAYRSFSKCRANAPLLRNTVVPSDWFQVSQLVAAMEERARGQVQASMQDTSSEFRQLLAVAMPGSEDKDHPFLPTIPPDQMADVRVCRDQWADLKSAIIAVSKSQAAITAVADGVIKFKFMRDSRQWVEKTLVTNVPSLLDETMCAFEWKTLADLERCSGQVGAAVDDYKEHVAVMAQEAATEGPGWLLIVGGLLGGVAVASGVAFFGVHMYRAKRGPSRRRYHSFDDLEDGDHMGDSQSAMGLNEETEDLCMD